MNTRFPIYLLPILCCTSVIAQDALSDARTLYAQLILSEPIQAAVEAPVASESIPIQTGVAVQFAKTTVAATPSPVNNTPVVERYLVSESWCSQCPAAKARFIASGGKEANVLTMAQARRLHNKIFDSVPHEYSYSTTTVTTPISQFKQPKVYHSITHMRTTLNGSSTPSHASILSHLRHGELHKGKRWQSWYLENWKVQQLYALHDDDHYGTVPYEPESESESSCRSEALSASIDGTPSTIAVLYILSEAFKDTTDDTDDTVMSSWFEYDLNAPDLLPSILLAILKDKTYTNVDTGITINWPGDQTFAIHNQSITLNPPIMVSASKYGVRARASIKEIRFNPECTNVTLVTSESLVPNITVNFK